jgi:AAA domain-containing protein
MNWSLNLGKLNITGLDEANLSTINLCAFSHPGVGKTVLAGTAGERMLIMDSDKGTESAAAQGSKAKRVSAIDHTEISDIYDYLANESHPFTWVWWDSLTLFQNRALIDEIMPNAVAQSPRQEEFVPSQREYLINMNHIMRWVRLFVDLPINFGISCHVLITEESDGTTVYMPAVQGKGMPSHVAGYMNVVGYYGKKEEKGKKPVRKLLVQPSGKFYAKDRFAALGNVLTDPTLPQIEQMIRKSPAGKGLIVPERRAGTVGKVTPAAKTTAASTKKAARKTASRGAR